MLMSIKKDLLLEISVDDIIPFLVKKKMIPLTNFPGRNFQPSFPLIPNIVFKHT